MVALAYFWSSGGPVVLAHGSVHCVPGITLPPGDANSFHFHCLLRFSGVVKKMVLNLDGSGGLES